MCWISLITVIVEVNKSQQIFVWEIPRGAWKNRERYRNMEMFIFFMDSAYYVLCNILWWRNLEIWGCFIPLVPSDGTPYSRNRSLSARSSKRHPTSSSYKRLFTVSVISHVENVSHGRHALLCYYWLFYF
jgi:hypothetical protein